MGDIVNLKINGKDYQAPKGKLLIEVCLENGIHIPNFCYYPDLTPQAACRMCLVRIEKMPKMATSCTVEVGEGMVVHTETEELLEARKGMLDFILGNHPLDCPVCDKGGQCELQDMVFEHGTVYAHYNVKKQATPEWRLSPFIAYDPQRCVRCYRCIRECTEVMDVNALGKIFRGTHEVIGPYGLGLDKRGMDKGYALDCEQCGNCVEICPVGALLSVDSRFRSRPWDMKETVTTCTHCGDGCQMNLGIRNTDYVRVAAKDMKGINGEFLCVKGRYGSSFISSPERITKPMIRRNGRLEEVTWEEALKFAANKLKEISSNNKNAVAILGSPRLTNESNFTLRRFAEKGIGTQNFGQVADADWDRFFANLTAPVATHKDVKKAKNILMIGGDATENHPLSGMVIRYAVRKSAANLMVVNSKRTKIARRQAKLFLHIRPESESAIVAALFEAESELPRLAELAKVKVEQLQKLREKVFAIEELMIVVGPEVKGATLDAVAQLAGHLNKDKERKVHYLPLATYNNTMGAIDMGLTPNGHSLMKAFGSQIQALYLAGSNPVEQYGVEWENALRKLSFLAVAELFMTQTAKLADVVFPINSFAEQDGTFTNNTLQVQRVHRAVEGSGQVRPDWMVVNALAREMRLDIGAKGSSVSIFRDIVAETTSYNGITYERIKKESAVQTSRALAPTKDTTVICQSLASECAKINTSADLNRTNVAQGEGLFRIGTMIRRSPVMQDAFGKPQEEKTEAVNA